MQPYANLSGDSGINAYDIAPDAIVVRYTNGWHYAFTTASTGAWHVAEMQRLATAGAGLSAYIARHAYGTHARKWR